MRKLDMRKIFDTNSSWIGLILRLGLGIVMFPHGMQKVFGWFGGFGLATTFHYMTNMEHIPSFFAALAILAESLGSVALIFGFLSRIAAFGIGIEMVVAALMVHVKNGFFMNWAGHQAGEGFEFHVLMVTIAAALILTGAGKWSIDRAISQKLNSKSTKE
jgi:putative oxidoreductase